MLLSLFKLVPIKIASNDRLLHSVLRIVNTAHVVLATQLRAYTAAT